MLKRSKLRKYLLALLCSEEVYQTPDCKTGPIWENCDGTEIDVHDTPTVQINDANHAPYGVNKSCAALAIRIDAENGVINPTEFCENTLSFEIDIIVEDSSSHTRLNTLDEIQCRIYYRLINTPVITDANDASIKYKSPLQMAVGNSIRLQVRDDSDFEGCYTIRTLTFTLDVRECIKKGNCDDRPLCFNFSELTALNKKSEDVLVSQFEEN